MPLTLGFLAAKMRSKTQRLPEWQSAPPPPAEANPAKGPGGFSEKGQQDTPALVTSDRGHGGLDWTMELGCFHCTGRALGPVLRCPGGCGPWRHRPRGWTVSGKTSQCQRSLSSRVLGQGSKFTQLSEPLICVCRTKHPAFPALGHKPGEGLPWTRPGLRQTPVQLKFSVILGNAASCTTEHSFPNR